MNVAQRSRRALLVTGALGWPAALCAQAGSQPATPSRISAKAAEAAFRRFWADWSRKPEHVAAAQGLDELLRAGPPSRTLRTGRACRDLVVDRLGAKPPAEMVLHGSLEKLAQAPQCWELAYDGRLTGGLVACVDAHRASVLLVWRTPGG